MKKSNYSELKDEENPKIKESNNKKSKNKLNDSKKMAGRPRLQIKKLQDLEKIFHPDLIREGKSLQDLRELNGISGLAQAMDLNLKFGIDTKDKKAIKYRIKKLGINTPIIVPSKPFWKLITEQFEDLTLKILLVAAVLSLIVGMIQNYKTGWTDSVGIFFALIIIIIITASNNYMREKQFEKINSKVEEKEVLTLRNSKFNHMSVYDLIVGDIIQIHLGDIIPVDGILFNGSNILADESSITGESNLIVKSPNLQDELPKSQTNPFILSGSKIMDGTGQILVCCVGSNSQLGKLKLSLQEEEKPTPLQMKLENVANQIGKIGLISAIITILVLIIYIIYDSIIGEINFLSIQALKMLVNAFMIGITILVMAVPEGLPLAVTIALAFSLGKLREENNLVKQLSSCEIMGGANNICSDKTGTLTKNLLSVTNIFIENSEKEPNKRTFTEAIRPDTFEKFYESICINSSANPKLKGKTLELRGNSTECALLEIVYNLGYNYENYRNTPNVIKVFPFNSLKKKMTTIYYHPNVGTYVVYMKGAGEIILENSSKIVTNTGFSDIYGEKRNDLRKLIDNYAKQSLRVIGMSYKVYNNNPSEYSEEELEKDMILLALIGLKDPLRPNIRASVNKCRRAGIRVRMVTGDNILTACSIAKECNILNDNFNIDDHREFQVLEGKKFREIVGDLVKKESPDDKKVYYELENIESFSKIARNLKVLARSTPEDKYKLVTGLIQLGNVVAVTGDGTNDAPALKKADIGFAMGITGTDVAKEAAGIILLDDNFSSILSACKWGRNIYDAIRKFIQFQLTVNIVALILAFIGSAFAKKSPLNPIQMLWVNLIMDTFASLALSTESATDELLKRAPQSRNENIINANMWRNILMQTLYQSICLCIILFGGPLIFNINSSLEEINYNPKKATHLTIFFNTFVMMQVFNSVNCRKLKKSEINVFKGIFKNPLFIIVEGITFIIQIVLVQFGGRIVHCVPLSIYQHLYCLGFAAGGLLVGVFIKFLPECIFEKIIIFKNEEISDIDKSIASVLKKKGSSRMNTVKKKSIKKN